MVFGLTLLLVLIWFSGFGFISRRIASLRLSLHTLYISLYYLYITSNIYSKCMHASGLCVVNLRACAYMCACEIILTCVIYTPAVIGGEDRITRLRLVGSFFVVVVVVVVVSFRLPLAHSFSVR